jgi:hypothetical protein
MLRPLRRLRFVVFPLFAGALVALGIRLGWAHDPSCPHHAGQAVAAAAMPSQHATHAGHGDSPPASPEAPCRCLDPDCCLSGVVAVLDADTGDLLVADASAFDASRRPMPVSVARPGAYSTHRLPFPHAPPGFDRLT